MMRITARACVVVMGRGRGLTTNSKDVLKEVALSSRKGISPAEKGAVWDVLFENERLAGENALLAQKLKTAEVQSEVTKMENEQKMIAMLRESYGANARGVVEFWLEYSLNQRYGDKVSRREKWIKFFKDTSTNGPDLLRCLQASNRCIKGAEAAASQLEGLFTNLSGDHHHSSMLDIVTGGKEVLIASSMSAMQKAMMQCLCTCAKPHAIPFRVVNLELEVKK